MENYAWIINIKKILVVHCNEINDAKFFKWQKKVFLVGGGGGGY